ncbi:MAG: DEAD/DEAH box helicase [Actinomycetota bacterium]
MICSFISELAYEIRLTSDPSCEQQIVKGSQMLTGSGIRWAPVEHQDNRTSSIEEAQLIAEQYDSLISQNWINEKGLERPLEQKDVLVVAPYNAQVSLLAQHLPDNAEVGTVDKFQGREGAVVLVSMTASSAADVPRGMNFLYDLHRLNVAVSRARALAVIVGSPTLLQVECRTAEQMRLANALCRFVEQCGSTHRTS